MTETKPQPIDYTDGPIHSYFGSSYSSHQVTPRVLAQSMPHEWQARLVQCLEELETAFAYLEIPAGACYDVKPAEDVYANELTDAQKALTGVTSQWDEEQDREIYWDADGNEIEGYAHIMVPVPDPLPSYSRGRTRVPRADQLPVPHSCPNCEGVDPQSCVFSKAGGDPR